MGRKALPYKIVDRSGLNRYGIVVDSLEALMKKAEEKFGVIEGMKVVIEQDGTEVDEDEYFSTLEANTSFVILGPKEEWIPPSQYNYVNLNAGRDERDGIDNSALVNLITRIRSDAGQISLLGNKDLETLSDMDPENLADIIPDKGFLEELKEASVRYLNDRRDTQEALRLLKLYHSATSSMVGHRPTLTRVVSIGTSTHDF